MTFFDVKIALRGISPIIWRRLRLAGTTTLAEFHYIIQIAMGWDDDRLHCFHIFGKDYGIAYEGGLSFPDDPRSIVLNDFGFDAGDKFAYTYNFVDQWLCDIRIEAVQHANDIMSVQPRCLSGQGRWNNSAHYKMDERIALLDVLDIIIHGKDTTTVGDIRTLIEDYDAIRFDRQSINLVTIQHSQQ